MVLICTLNMIVTMLEKSEKKKEEKDKKKFYLIWYREINEMSCESSSCTKYIYSFRLTIM